MYAFLHTQGTLHFTSSHFMAKSMNELAHKSPLICSRDIQVSDYANLVTDDVIGCTSIEV